MTTENNSVGASVAVGTKLVKGKKQKSKIRKTFMRQPFSIIIFVLLILYVISFLSPLIWAFICSFKSRTDFVLNKFGLPEEWMFENYPAVFKELYIRVLTKSGFKNVYAWQLIGNALFYSIGSTLVTTTSHCITAYAAARYGKYLICRLLYPLVIVVMLLPIVGSLASELQMLHTIGAYDNVVFLMFMKGGFLGTNFLIFYATFKGISWEYAEAAFIDGASHARVLFTIMIPLAMTTVTALALLTFIGYWNDWSVNVIYLPNFPMISYALYTFQNNTINSISSVPHRLAACMIVLFPILVIFLVFRKKLMGNLTVGGLKG